MGQGNPEDLKATHNDVAISFRIRKDIVERGQNVADHLLLWKVIPDNRKSTIVRFAYIKFIEDFERWMRKEAETNKVVEEAKAKAKIQELTSQVVQQVAQAMSKKDSASEQPDQTTSQQTPNVFSDILNKNPKNPQ